MARFVAFYNLERYHEFMRQSDAGGRKPRQSQGDADPDGKTPSSGRWKRGDCSTCGLAKRWEIGPFILRSVP